MITISEYNVKLGDNAAIICQPDTVNDDRQFDMSLKVMLPGTTGLISLDASIYDFRKLAIAILDAVVEAFENETNSDDVPDDAMIRCEACGYTQYDAVLAGDHRQCRGYPFFPGEKGKSYAVGR